MEKSKRHTPEEILNALHVIQDTCEYYLFMAMMKIAKNAHYVQ